MITAATATGLSVRQLCALFGVNRAWYHAARGRAEADPDGALRAAVEQLALEFPRYGYRRVTAALVRAGWAVNHKRVVRVMRDAALLCRPRRRFVRTTQAGPGRPVYPNLLPQTTLSGLNQAWIADITYIRLPTRFVYLASILDAYSRRLPMAASPTTAHLFIVQPFSGAGGTLMNLFSTHPPIEERVRRLRAMRRGMRYA